jgi:hypothetical protein
MVGNSTNASRDRQGAVNVDRSLAVAARHGRVGLSGDVPTPEFVFNG